MTAATPSIKPKFSINGHLIPGVTLASVIVAAFWLGGELREIQHQLKGNWTVPDMVIPDLILAARHPTLKVPDSTAIVEARKKASRP